VVLDKATTGVDLFHAIAPVASATFSGVAINLEGDAFRVVNMQAAETVAGFAANAVFGSSANHTG
jgi:hypothetical protein